MITGLKPKRLLYKDGTGQGQRLMEALNPGSVRIDERSIADLIGFAQQFAKELAFFDEDNNPNGTWEAFLMDRFHEESLPDSEKERIKKQFLSDLLSYIDSPESFSGDEEKMRRFSQPHLALFVSFLQLLGLIKDQLNGLTKKHLDFYYLQVLGLNKKQPIPDVVNVIIELGDNINELLVSKGTLLSAGKDSLGKDLIYATDKDIVVSQATVENIKTVFVEKKITTLSDARTNIVSNGDDAFMSMMQLALGERAAGDPLPVYRNTPVNYIILLAMYNKLKTSDDNASDEYRYVTEKLLLSKAEFVSIFNTYLNLNSTAEDWEKVYGYLDHAFKEKIKQKRQLELMQVKLNEADAVTGFSKMLEFALGDPDPGDKLPIYRGQPVDLYKLNATGQSAFLQKLTDDLTSRDESIKKEASEYVTDELLLSENDLIFSFKTISNSKASEQDWDKVYQVMELAERKKRKYELPSPYTEEWLNVYAVPDAKANGYAIDAGDGDSSLRFKTFGGKSAQDPTTIKAANIGFAVSSGQLNLAEGNRTITLTISFTKNETIDVAEISRLTTLLSDPIQYFLPFVFLISSAKEWIKLAPKTSDLKFGNFIVNESAQAFSVTVSGANIATSTSAFSQNDVGRYFVLADGSIYQVSSLLADTKTASVKLAGKTNPQQQIKKYNTTDIFFNAMQVVLMLGENDPAVTPPDVADTFVNIKSGSPVVAMVLNQIPLLKEGKINPNDADKYISLYQQFKNLQLEKVNVRVDVANLKTLLLENDFSVLDYKKPFEPFGFNPVPGNRFYFTHPELAAKQLQKLNVKFEWMNPPKSFQDYYKNYWKIINSSDDLKAAYTDHQITDNTVFEARMKLVDSSAVISLGTIKLFSDNAQVENVVEIKVTELIAANAAGYVYTRENEPAMADEVVNSKRYFSLELGAVDFQHSIYSTLLTAQAFLNPVASTTTPVTYSPNPLRSITLNPPYTPKLKVITASYVASFEINFINGSLNNKNDTAYHINAFGYKQLQLPPNNSTGNTYFLPYLKNEGELYLGLGKLAVPQNLSILFEMAEGSADPDLDKQQVTWSYLRNNEWQELKGTNLVADTTNGLLNTGIIELNIPPDATNNNTLLNDGFHWLRATVNTNTAAVSDTVDIMTQAISATFINNDNADDHLLTLLAPGTIRSTVEQVPAIKQVNQPFTSLKGRPGETDRFFYNRASERLRHKNRALTMWDYERIVLEEFPGIYKVKCIPAEFDGVSIDPGRVDVIVIPDIKGRLPFNPFQPKVPAETILQVQQYVEQRAPAFATIKVKNPSYLQVKTRFAVKFNEGYNEGFYTIKLEEELKKFLAPWAYDESADISIGGRVYANVIVNFLAERPYVNYVAGIKLFQSKDGVSFIDARIVNNGENVIKVDSPDLILVSALKHDIDIISDEGFEEDDFTGINYMRIGLDFVVG